MNFVNEVYKISVLVPIYGVEQYIERCARSLFEQTYPNLEYVFVNDCTPDRSMEILRQVLENYPNRAYAVKIINHNTNQGIAAARNTLLDNAAGDFVIWVDSDDWLETNAIEILAKSQLETNADLVSGNRIIHYHNGDSLFEEKKYSNKDKMVIQMMQYGWEHFITGRLIRKSLFVDHGLRWEEGLNVAEDRYMMTLLAYIMSGFSTIDDVVYHYERRNESSLTGNNNGIRLTKNSIQQLGNCLLSEQFFKDKESKFFKESTRCVMEQMDRCIKTSLAYSIKDSFYEIVRIIDSRSDDDLHLIGWKKNEIKGWYLHKYNTMRLGWLIKKTIHFTKRKIRC